MDNNNVTENEILSPESIFTKKVNKLRMLRVTTGKKTTEKWKSGLLSTQNQYSTLEFDCNIDKAAVFKRCHDSCSSNKLISTFGWSRSIVTSSWKYPDIMNFSAQDCRSQGNETTSISHLALNR